VNKLKLLIALLATALSAQGQRGFLHPTAVSDAAVAEAPWPWRNQRQGYFDWWAEQVGLRILENAHVRPGVRYMHQRSELTYIADEAVVGGQITIDADILNDVNFPAAVENRLRNITIDLPSGNLGRTVSSWTSLAQLDVTALGLTLRGSYWSGSLSPGLFPQLGDVGVLVNSDELIGITAREIAGTSALNNATSLELHIHPLQWLSGFRRLEWQAGNGFYVGGDWSIGWVKATDLTFKQGRELLGNVDMEQEIRGVLPSQLANLIDVAETAELLLTAVESRLPLYGFGLPVVGGRTSEYAGWVGYQWNTKVWTGNARVGMSYQTQRLSNDHPALPTLRVHRWAPTLHFNCVFNQETTNGAIFSE
jgi:hypothetical protein